MQIIFYNPLAHNKLGEKEAHTWVKWANLDENDMQDITKVHNMAEVIAGLTENDQVYILGGDGTLSRFADAIRDVDLKCAVYYACSGTGNDFLRDIPEFGQEEPVQINKYITNLPHVFIRGEEHVFLNNVSFGLDGYCCEVADQMQAVSDKPVNYSSIAIGGLLGKFVPRSGTVTVDGVSKSYKEIWLAPTMNGRYVGGGLMLTPFQMRLNEEGTVSCAVIHDSPRIPLLLKFPGISKGKHVKYTKIYDCTPGDEIHVKFDTPCAVQIDGETYLNITEYTVYSRRKMASLKKVQTES